LNPIRVLIADNHPIVRRGIRAWLAEQPDFQVCGEAETGLQALVKTALLKPDITIIDLDIPEMSGLEVARLIHKVPTSAEVLIFTEHFAENTAGEILRSGAAGYLLKADSYADFLSAMEHMRLRKIYLTRRLTAPRTGEPSSGDVPPAWTPQSGLTLLTPRERQVFALVATGKRSHEVARRLGITRREVAAHRKHVMRKLRSSPLTDAYPFAYLNQRLGA